MPMELLQPHTINLKLDDLGFEGVTIQYTSDEWYLVFFSLDDYVNFMTLLNDNESIGNIMRDAASNVYNVGRDPLSFSVVTHIQRFEDWSDWQWFFQTLFTFMTV